MDPAGNAISLAKDIYASADLIHTQIKLVKANKEQSGLLGKRIHTLIQCIQNLEKKELFVNKIKVILKRIFLDLEGYQVFNTYQLITVHA